jgi:hypothetical protein
LPRSLIKSFTERKERIAVLELGDFGATLTSFRVTPNEQEIEVLDAVQIPADPKGDEATLKAALSKLARPRRTTTLLALHRPFGATFAAPVSVLLPDPKRSIDSAVLDNAVAAGMWKLFNRERAQLASAMGVIDLDVVLAQVRVDAVKLDGHRVVNPIDFRARSISIDFVETVLPRTVSAALTGTVDPSDLAALYEVHATLARTAARAFPEASVLVAHVRPTATELSYVRGPEAGSAGPVAWGSRNLHEAIARAFSVETPTAARIYETYLKQEASPRALRRLERVLTAELSAFTRLLHPVLADAAPDTLYLLSDVPLPAFVFGGAFRAKALRVSHVATLDTDSIAGAFGFKLIRNRSDELFSALPLSVLLEFYFHRRGDTMNKIAARHTRWSTAP